MKKKSLEEELRRDQGFSVPRRPKSLRATIGLVLVVTVIGTLGWFVFSSSSSITFTSDGTEELSQEEAEKEVAELLERVSRHILLPEGEIPLVATVVDAAALIVEQPFYSGVQDDDRLLIYGQSLKAVIYSPERDIIVNVGPVQFSQPTDESLGEGAVVDEAVEGE